MTRSFVTGGTGLLGRHLVERLLARGGEVWVLVRAERLADHAERLSRFQELARAGGASLHVVHGDVTEDGLGLSAEALGQLAVPKLDACFHAAAYYDIAGNAERLREVNVEGTRRLVSLLESSGFRGVLHHVSSIAVAGDFADRFREDALEEGQGHPTEYHRSKYESERLVRASKLAHRIYRPGAIVGHSKTGEMDRIDGAYYVFRAVHALRGAVPTWIALPRTEGAKIPMVPVDFVADAIDAIAARSGFNGKTFHVVDPDPPSFRTTYNLIADAAGSPRMGKFGLSTLGKWLPGAGAVIGQLGSLRFLRERQLESLGIPPVVLTAQNADVEYDATNLLAALDGTGIVCPRQESYVEALWDYYLRHLDPKREPEQRDRAALAGKVALITGASSGIGEELARYCAGLGMKVVLVARRAEELERVRDDIRAAGGQAEYHAADLSDFAACDAAVEFALSQYGAVDVLVNNAGRSIRRPLAESLDRFHDLERIMQINYFGPARLIRGVLPGMRRRKSGVIVNVLSAGARLSAPRFGAYTSSKAALGQLGDTLAAEHLHEGIRVVNVFLPWVRTPMMDASGKYENTRAMTPAEAARDIVTGIVERKQHVLSSEIRRRFLLMVMRPELFAGITNLIYRAYADEPGAHPELDFDRAILKRFVKGPIV